MSPTVVTILIALGVLMMLACTLLLLVLLIADVAYRLRRRRQARRERAVIAGWHERMAAQNGRPDSNAILQRATRRD